MPNKTLYIRKSDLPIWERAHKQFGDALSPMVTESLREKLEALRDADKEAFAAAVASARSFWKRYRALIEAEELPEPYLSAVNEIGGELKACDDPFVAAGSGAQMKPVKREVRKHR